MRLKRYIVNDMREALPLIRTDLGPDAMIVQTQTRRPKGLGRLWRKPRLEVLAAVEEDRPQPREVPLPARPAPEETNRLRLIEERLEKLSRALESVTALPPVPAEQPLRSSLEGLRQQGLSPVLLDHLEAVGAPKDAAALAMQLRRMLPACVPLTLRGGRPDVLLFLGPTGVGKTTTLAKVAAELVTHRGCKVALATIDTYRVAAVPQLEIYAGLLGVPLCVAYEPRELREAIEGFSDYDVVLVDTPGRSPADSEGLGELRQYLEVLPRARSLLLIEAGAHLDNMRSVAAAFGAESCEGVVFTKLDETKVYGPVFSMACELAKPIFYLTTGQNVPQDIEPATADELLVMLMGSTGTAKCASGDFVRVDLRHMARGVGRSPAWS